MIISVDVADKEIKYLQKAYKNFSNLTPSEMKKYTALISMISHKVRDLVMSTKPEKVK